MQQNHDAKHASHTERGRKDRTRSQMARLRMRRRVHAHLKDVRLFRALGFRYDSARGGRFVIDEEEFFEVARG